MLEHLHTKPVKPRRVVVVGAGGFVGGAIARELARDGVPVLGLTRKEVDLTADGAAAAVTEKLEPEDSVVFVSALAPARTSAMLLQNLRMAEAVGQALSARPVAHLLYISSDAVYADDANPVTERSCCQPSSLHGMMHAARELMLKTDVKVPLAILRPSLLYGARDPHNGYGPNRFRRLAEKGETITLFGEGEEQRDHIYIDDVARLVALVLSHRSRGTLNVATGVSTSFREIAEKVVSLSGKRPEIRGTPRQNPITHRHFDITDCLKTFPQFRYTPLQDGLTRAVQPGAS
ncbi:MAG TPA: NAD(P)-dependent oxidoreductase [Xanthobacteraceae bacterium]|nr:NAD(P)-dependent oxidoreductase [Xanthobacteraceae bacterium]